MKILYDYQIFEQQIIGGVSRYFCEIISHLPDNIHKTISVKYSDNVYIKQKKLVPDLSDLFDPRQKFLKNIEFSGKGRLFQLAKWGNPKKYSNTEILNRNLTIKYLGKQDFDVFHPTYYHDYFLKYIGNKPFVITIHDMTHELYPEYYSSVDELDFVKTKASLAKKSAHIIAVSENTKKDLIEILGIKGDKISVIYHASSIKKEKENSIIELPEKYLLYVGDRTAEYKNFKFMARALAPLLKENEKLYVLCTGKEFDNKENDFFQHLELKGRFISKFVPDSSLFEIYNRALSLVFPSYSEGFGIPILEAFQSRCPVILAKASCFPEIAKEAALFFEPKKMDDLREQVNKLLHNDLIRNILIQRGTDRVKDFSWEISAQKTLEVYKRVIN